MRLRLEVKSRKIQLDFDGAVIRALNFGMDNDVFNPLFTILNLMLQKRLNCESLNLHKEIVKSPANIFRAGTSHVAPKCVAVLLCWIKLSIGIDVTELEKFLQLVDFRLRVSSALVIV